MNHAHEAMFQHHQHNMADREEMEMMGEGLGDGEYAVSLTIICGTFYTFFNSFLIRNSKSLKTFAFKL